jgi:hypothetical protein
MRRNIQTTMNIYTQAVSDQKREANSKVVEIVLTGAKPLRGKRLSATESVTASVTGADCDFAISRKPLQVIEVVALEIGCGGWI